MCYTLNDSNKNIINDGRLTIILFFLCSLLLFDITHGNDFSFFKRKKQSRSCEQLRFVHPDKLVVDNCFDLGRVEENEFVPARYTPLLFAAMPINNASRDMLMTIKGIGPAMAEDIIAYRHQFGPFTNNMDLINLHGIGPKRAAGFATVFTFAEAP